MKEILKLQSKMGDSSFIVGVCDENRNTSRDSTEERVLKKQKENNFCYCSLIGTDFEPQIYFLKITHNVQ